MWAERSCGVDVERAKIDLVGEGIHQFQDVRLLAEGLVGLEKILTRKILLRIKHDNLLVQDGDFPQRQLWGLQFSSNATRRSSQADPLLM